MKKKLTDTSTDPYRGVDPLWINVCRLLSVRCCLYRAYKVQRVIRLNLMKKISRFTRAVDLLTTNHLRYALEIVFRQTDIFVEFHCLGICSPMEYQIFGCIRVYSATLSRCYSNRCKHQTSAGGSPVADLEGGRAGSPLDDVLTPSLTVMLANAKFWSFYCITWYSEYSKWLPPVAFWQL